MLTYELLDEILSIISSATPDIPTSSELIFKDHSLPSRDREVILQKLMKEGLIDFMMSTQSIHKLPNGVKLYFITFDGILLLQKGGYAKKKRREICLNKYKVIIASAAAVGAILAAIFSGVNIYSKNQNHEKSTTDTLLRK
jgi:hypothetical protein